MKIMFVTLGMCLLCYVSLLDAASTGNAKIPASSARTFPQINKLFKNMLKLGQNGNSQGGLFGGLFGNNQGYGNSPFNLGSMFGNQGQGSPLGGLFGNQGSPLGALFGNQGSPLGGLFGNQGYGSTTGGLQSTQGLNTKPIRGQSAAFAPSLPASYGQVGAPIYSNYPSLSYGSHRPPSYAGGNVLTNPIQRPQIIYKPIQSGQTSSYPSPIYSGQSAFQTPIYGSQSQIYRPIYRPPVHTPTYISPYGGGAFSSYGGGGYGGPITYGSHLSPSHISPYGGYLG